MSVRKAFKMRAFSKGAGNAVVFQPRAKLVMADPAAYDAFANARNAISSASRTAVRVVGNKLLTAE